jgi:hypothetical protein
MLDLASFGRIHRQTSRLYVLAKDSFFYYFKCYFCDQNYFVIFALLGIISKLILLSLAAKSNQKSYAVLKKLKN